MSDPTNFRTQRIEKLLHELEYENTDRELYREPDKTGCGDYYSNSIHVTQGGSIGINVGGHVIVMPLESWHALATVTIEAQCNT